MNTILQATLTALASVPRVHKVNEVPDLPTFPYVEISVMRDRPTTYTLDATHGVGMWRIVSRSFGQDLDGALAFDQRVADLLLDKRLTVPGYDCGPCRIELASLVVRDSDTDGVVGVTTTYTFATTKEG